ncbi:hypothetical protein UFOVP978_57 [uncultured Caudovirales phage]|uniref:Uncharacterized protein n=1 Tax=uncultured Caudovirales phage TaxID=2100421 RepID=A0A6J5Q350_9CAUD|nr:hypothetical protein UFOVP978_57 [uncultured Caudovirales phage]
MSDIVFPTPHVCDDSCPIQGVMFPSEIVVSTEDLQMDRVYNNCPDDLYLPVTSIHFYGRTHPNEIFADDSEIDGITLGFVGSTVEDAVIRIAEELQYRDPTFAPRLLASITYSAMDRWKEESEVANCKARAQILQWAKNNHSDLSALEEILPSSLQEK